MAVIALDLYVTVSNAHHLQHPEVQPLRHELAVDPHTEPRLAAGVSVAPGAVAVIGDGEVVPVVSQVIQRKVAPVHSKRIDRERRRRSRCTRCGRACPQPDEGGDDEVNEQTMVVPESGEDAEHVLSTLVSEHIVDVMHLAVGVHDGHRTTHVAVHVQDVRAMREQHRIAENVDGILQRAAVRVACASNVHLVQAQVVEDAAADAPHALAHMQLLPKRRAEARLGVRVVGGEVDVRHRPLGLDAAHCQPPGRAHKIVD
mmetsp:Transcript_28748/g.83977  ORF Transcript_28748/g.83977 Transcript_28748/m.83977 type:complete len:258 (-) Transcript_28748:32-805(-)